MLFRSLDEIRENISSFWVYEKNDQVVGVCSLKRGWGRLGRIAIIGCGSSIFRTGNRHKDDRSES